VVAGDLPLLPPPRLVDLLLNGGLVVGPAPVFGGIKMLNLLLKRLLPKINIFCSIAYKSLQFSGERRNKSTKEETTARQNFLDGTLFEKFIFIVFLNILMTSNIKFSSLCFSYRTILSLELWKKQLNKKIKL
jgi:hypothetical protein